MDGIRVLLPSLQHNKHQTLNSDGFVYIQIHRWDHPKNQKRLVNIQKMHLFEMTDLSTEFFVY